MRSVLPNFPPHCDPRKQTESGSTVPPYQPWTSSNPSLPLFSPPPNVTSGLDLSNQRLPPFSNPQVTRGSWISGHPDPTGLPSQSTAPIYQGAIYADPNHPYYRPLSPGTGQNPLSHSSTTAVPSVSASQRPLVPQTVGNVEPQQIIIASGYSNPSLVIPSASGAGQLSRSSDAIYQRSQSDSTLVNPSSPHHVQKSQPSIDQYVSYPGPLPQGTMVNPSPQSSSPAVPSESASQGASVTPNVGNEVLQAPTAASGFSNPPPFVSTAGVAGQHNPNDASNQRLQTDSTLTDPSPSHPVKISQLNIENPSLQSQPSAAPSGSEIASLTDHTSTDAATQELPGSTSRQVKKHPALEGSAGLDAVDHPPNGSMHKLNKNTLIVTMSIVSVATDCLG